MQNLSIRHVLLILLLVPVFSALVSFYQILPNTLEKVENSRTFESGVAVTQAAADLVHELQKERGSSAGLLAATENRSQHRARVISQQEWTDRSLEAFLKGYQIAIEHASLARRTQALSEGLKSITDDLKFMREKVFTGGATVPEVVTFYTKTINQLMDGIAVMTEGSERNALENTRGALRSLLLVKEFAGLERATGNALLSIGRTDDALSQRYIGLVALQTHYVANLRNSMEAGGHAKLMDSLPAPLTKQYEAAQKDILANIGARKAEFALKSAEWWTLTTNRIDELKRLEVEIISQIAAASREEGAAATQSAIATVAIQVLAVLIGILVTVLIGRAIAGPIRRASDALERSMRGETDVPLPPEMSNKSEIGRISNAVGKFIGANIEREMLIAEREQSSRKLTEARKRLLGEMETEIGGATANVTVRLADAARLLGQKSGAMLSTVGSVRQAQDEALAASEQTAGTVSEVTRLSDELSRSISEIAEQSQRTAQLTQEVQGRADQSREAARAFEDVASAIASITDLINSIAAQTNLLALNATIEAARAGEAGRGFAVVAGEVKGLAGRTVEATRTIEAKVNDLKSIAKQAAEQSVALSTDVGTIQGLNAAIAAAVHEQHMTSESFTEQLRHLAAGVSAVAEHVSSIAELGHHAVSAAESVGHVSKEMESAIGTIGETLPEIIANTTRRIAG